MHFNDLRYLMEFSHRFVVTSSVTASCLTLNVAGSVDAEDKSAKGRMKFAQYQALSKAFYDAIFEFNEEQLRYREKCKNQIRRQMEVSGRPVSDQVLEDMLEKVTDHIKIYWLALLRVLAESSV